MLLRSMRKGFLSAIFLGLLVMGAVGLIFSDWNGMFKGGFNKTDVAKVDGTPIKIAEFNSRLNRILHQQNIDASSAYQMGLVDNILNSEIFEILIKKDAAKLGIRVSDRIIAEQIKDMIAPLKSDEISDKDALKKFLEMQGMSEKQLVAALRDDMTSKILKSTIATASYVPDALVKDIQSYRGITKDVEYIFLPNASQSVKTEPSEKDLESYYAARMTGYMNPETRDITVAVLDTTKIAKPKISDDDVKSFFNDNQDKFKLPPSVTVEQSLLSDEAKAKVIANDVKSGKSMSDAVKAATGDLKSFQGKNNLSKDGLPSDIATPVFAAKAGDVVGPLKSPLGYHVIKVIDINAEHTASLDSVKDKIRKELEDEKAGNAVFDMTNDIEDRLANGETYETLAKDYPLTITHLKNLKQNSPFEKGSAWTEKEFSTLLTKAYALKDTTPSEMTDLSPSKLYSVRADKINPAQPKALKDVKEDLIKKWTAENKSQLNLLSAQKQVEDLNAGKIKFETLKPTIAKSMTSKGDKALAADAANRFLSAEKGKFILAISREKNGIYVGKVNHVTLPTEEKIDDATRKSIESDIANAGYMAYMDSLQNKYSVTINDALLERTYGKTEKDTQ